MKSAYLYLGKSILISMYIDIICHVQSSTPTGLSEYRLIGTLPASISVGGRLCDQGMGIQGSTCHHRVPKSR